MIKATKDTKTTLTNERWELTWHDNGDAMSTTALIRNDVDQFFGYYDDEGLLALADLIYYMVNKYR